MSSACCKSYTPPQEVLLSDRHSGPTDMVEVNSARESARLLEDLKESLCSVPKLPLRDLSGARSCSTAASPAGDLRDLLTNLGYHQKELYEKVMEQQRELQKELLALQVASRANTDAQGALQRCQESFLAEFRDVLMTSATTSLSASPGQGTTPRTGRGTTPVILEELTAHTSQDGVKEPAQVVVGNAQQEASPRAPMLPSQHTSSLKSTVRLQLRATAAAKQSVVAADIRGLWSRINYLLRSKGFEIAVALAIITNAFIMCWESQYHGLDVGFNLQYPGRHEQAKYIWPGAEGVFNCLDWFFGILFVIEMLVKLMCWRCKYFYDSEDKVYHGCGHLQGLQLWNLLDFFCVAAFLSDKMASVSAVNPQMLRLLRLFRLFRLVRLLRWLESLDHLYVMTTAITSLSKVLSWAVVLLTVLLVTCNLFLVQILQATYFDQVIASELTEDALRKHRKIFEYFGTCTRCMLSMFEITLGNWPPVARLLAEEVSQWFTLLCVLHKLTIGFAVIGVITAIILQETFKVVQTDDLIMFRQKKRASRVLRKKMKALFDTLDTEKDGKLNMQEFTAIGEDPEIRIWLASLDLETDDLPTLFSLIDEDCSGHISLDELIARMPRIKGAARGIDMLAMMQKLQIANSRQTRRKAAGSLTKGYS